MTKSRNINGPRKVWTWAEEELLRRHYEDSLTDDLAKVCGCSVGALRRKASHLGLAKSLELIAAVARERSSKPDHGGRKAQFRKGNVPANKGVKHPKGWAPGEMAKTQFKPGNLSHTWVPIGSYTINGDGHLDRKVADERHVPRHVNWKPVYRLVWEAAHGPIPPGHLVAFLPGKQTTVLEEITVDVLELVTRQEWMRRHTIHNLPPELVEVTMLRGALTRQINKRTKELNP